MVDIYLITVVHPSSCVETVYSISRFPAVSTPYSNRRFELCWIRVCFGVLHDVGRKEIIVAKNDAALLPPGTPTNTRGAIAGIDALRV